MIECPMCDRGFTEKDSVCAACDGEEGLLGRYLKEEDEATHYEDAHTGEGRRRLSVCARDLYRLVDRFRGTIWAECYYGRSVTAIVSCST